MKALLLPGHILENYDTLFGWTYDKIIAVGHSMGGLLALKLAMERHLDGIVSLATPIYLTSRKPILAPIAQYFVKYVNKKMIRKRSRKAIRSN